MRADSILASLVLALPLAAAPALGAAEQPAPQPWYELGGQVTGIDQTLFPFRSPYQGTNSLRSSWPPDNAFSHTYTAYLGVRPLPGIELYLNPEMARGYGVSGALGLAGFTNGDVIRNPTLGQDPYIARIFGRFMWPLTRETALVPPGENVIGGALPTSRIQLTLGKLGANDIFDLNGYASSTRTQFQNWALINDAAYDYAADTRGYTEGGALEWIRPELTLRYGLFRMPAVANGLDLDPDLAQGQAHQVEAELHPKLGLAAPATVRVRGYLNRADMGSYAAAVARAPAGQVPDITSVRTVGALKYGFGLNAEQPLGDDGNTGLFARIGWNDGRTEAFAYTEAERSLSLGGQLSGTHWHRETDRLAAALVVNGLSPDHADYLAHGGLGFLLGDGQLNYGPETIFEAYYADQLCSWAAATLDYQGILNPGYNQDRGPASVLSVRLHLEI